MNAFKSTVTKRKQLPQFHLFTLFLFCFISMQVEATPRVLPNDFTNTEGGADENTALGRFSNTAQVVYSQALVSAAGINVGDSITGLAFRVDSGDAAPVWSVADYQIRLATSVNAPGNLDASFVNNRGSDYTVVRSGPLAFDGTEFPTGASPNAFGPSLSFNLPFIYTGGDLLLEYTHSTISGGGESADGEFPSFNEVQAQYSNGFDGTSNDFPSGASGFPIIQFEVNTVHIVTNNNDSGPGSLRDVVDNAAAGDTITFDRSLAGQTITLTSGQIGLSKDVTIDGSALSSQVAISGNSASRVFDISNNTSVTLNALTLQDGSAGNGGLIKGGRIDGILDINDSTLKRGIASVDGGALRVFGETTIRRSLFTQNTANGGGAAIINGNQGRLRVINSTITNNENLSGNNGRGIIHYVNSSPSATNIGSMVFENSTIANNIGVGINLTNPGDYHLSNTLISGNSFGAVFLFNSATLTTNINNLCDSCGFTTTVQQDALIAPLADNGGPTLTHALYSNSPALNSGDNAAAVSLTTDQRGTGFSRVLAGTVDIGAFEGSVPVPVRAVNLSASANTGNEAAGTVITLTATAVAPVVGDQSVSIGVSGAGVTTSDFALSNTTITINNGETTGTVTFTVQDDTVLEGNETAILSISNPSTGLSLGTTTSQNISIIDSLNAPTTPVVNHGPPTVCAGNAALLTWTGNLNSAAQWVVYTDSCGGTQIDSTTSNASIVNPPANAASISYFVRGEGGSVVTPGMCGVHTVPITPREDASFSYPATTYLTTDADPTPVITGVSGGTFSRRVGTGSGALSLNSTTGTIDLSATPPGVYTIEYETPGLCDGTTTQIITINDGGADISVSDAVAVTEGNTGSVTLSYTVSLSRASSGTVIVDFATADGTAEAGQDYTAIGTTTLTFNSGELSKTVTVTVNGDAVVENNETVLVNLSNAVGSNVTIVDPQGSGTINNDDSAAVTISDENGNEDDGSITLTATLDSAVQDGFSVDISTSDGSATTADNDYTALNNVTLNFTGTAGETQTFSVSPTADTNGEADETLSVSQSNVQASSGSINSAITISDTATITIANDDPITLVVLNNNDSGPDSLRDIVDRAADGDTIIFDASLAGQTITLTSGQIGLSKDVTIDGSALSSQVAISGNSSSRVFQISANTSVTLNALALQDGSARLGGLVRGEAGVTLDISDSTFQRGVASNNGGALFVEGETTIRRSLFTQNTANNAGAVILNGTAGSLRVINSTITNNENLSATSGRSMIDYRNQGAAVADAVVLENSTIANNIGVGVILANTGDYHLSNTLISGNSFGGVFLLNSAALATNINNLCDNCGFTTTVQQNALVAPLANNGGPTLTHALYSNSPALDAGNNAAAASLTTDQRGTGFNRVLAGTVDIGAFEGSVPAPIRQVNLSASANIGSEAAGTVITVTATADAPVVGDQSVSIGVSGAGVTASDYVLSNTSITIANGQTTGTVTFTVQDDALVEASETATLSLSNPSVGLSLGSTVSHNIAITDNDRAAVTIDDVSGAEDGGPITVTATLDVAVQGGFSVELNTTDGSATAANNDYTALSSMTLNFAGTAGETQTATVVPNADTVVESNETLTVNQSNVSNSLINISDNATVTINNDDTALVTLNNASGNEDDGAIVVTATLNNAVQGGLTVALNTSNGTATLLNGDYTPLINSSLVFLGTAGETQQINLEPTTDATVELDEILTLSQSNSLSVNSAAITISDTATITIVNDDSATVTIGDVSSREDDGAITVTAALDNAVQGGFSVNVSSTDGTATVLGNDYSALSNASLAFTGTAGETQVFTVVPTADSIVEPNESLTVSQSSLSVSNLAVSIVDTATVTIVNDDTASVTLSNISGNEDDGPITVTATLNNAVQGGFSVDVRSADGSATLVDNDYVALSATTLNFTGAANESQTFSLTPTADAVIETNENVLISQSNLSLDTAFDAASLDTSDTAAVTIINDDTALITVETLSNALEGGQNGQFRISSSNLLSSDTELSFSVSGTAIAGVDYASLGASFILPAQTNELIVDVIANLDGIVDDNETVQISLSATNNVSAIISTPSSAEMLIIDGDDSDSDGIENSIDNCPDIANPDQVNLDGDSLGNVCDSDIDGDGLSNQYELANGLNPFNSLDRDADPDNDGFTNLEEFNFGSDPQVADTDENNNGIPDSVEEQGVNIVPILQLLLLDD